MTEDEQMHADSGVIDHDRKKSEADDPQVGMSDPMYDEKRKWLRRAQSAFQASTDFLDTNVREQWERNLYNFRSEHPPGVSRSNGYRNKIFRPKTRTSIRQHEASLAEALFTNSDLVYLEAHNKNDPAQATAAKLNQALLQYRLENTIPWFSTVLGAYQDTHKHGIAIGKTYWKFETRKKTEMQLAYDDFGEIMYDDDGNMLGEEVVVDEEVIADQPVVDLVPPENFRFDPNADWRDIAQDSPYLIEMIPMYAGDVVAMAEQDDPKTGAPAWYDYSIGEILSHGTQTGQHDSTRMARRGNKGTDPTEISVDSEFQTVWVHFNIYRDQGVDYAYYTVGTGLLLSDPVPLEEYYAHGRSAYQVGFSVIESHNTNPPGLAELGENLQKETNLLADQRIENVKLVLNKRYFLKRQGNIDIGALMRNVPGGGVMVDDPKNDVNVVNTPDVTSSSYAEQDRLNMDMDDLMGTMSQSTVQANRSLNETVGGMNIMNRGSNTVQEYMMKTFIESWVEPVLRSLVKLIQMYETDETVLVVAAEKAQVMDEIRNRFSDPRDFDAMLQKQVLVSINVGMGNTSPAIKMQKLNTAVQNSASIPQLAQRTNWDEVSKEIYSYAGFGDGSRFLISEEEASKGQGEEGPPPEIQLKMQQMKQDGQLRQAEMEMEDRHFQQELANKREIEMMKLADNRGITLAKLKAQMESDARRDRTQRDIKALDASVTNREMDLKRTTGEGI